ncbi:polyprenyl diphosphate synthase [Propionivibrio limicola]|uniref:polyprenyl diphosphate synthase n=1 Tax=Propionivibrio limicola TaxID=167645 RepID=UPI001292ADFD|nr:polyprenyl diphosphate synthase [Propionivibrio limicola]
MGIFKSTTRDVPEGTSAPKHVAIIMDGNGRWAKKRLLPRVAGHHRGVVTVRNAVKYCLAHNIEYLTLFAFSSENWRRPEEEVRLLMELFVRALRQEVAKLDRNGVCLKVVGDLSRFDSELQALIKASELQTASNTRLTLTVAANYGGRWDILQAVNRLALEHPEKGGHWDEADLTPYLAMSFAPEPDLFIRTGGEERISNFLLWQLAYSEFYFTKTLWPEFDSTAFDRAIASYQKRERRFGRTSEQLGDGSAVATSRNEPTDGASEVRNDA